MQNDKYQQILAFHSTIYAAFEIFSSVQDIFNKETEEQSLISFWSVFTIF